MPLPAADNGGPIYWSGIGGANNVIAVPFPSIIIPRTLISNAKGAFHILTEPFAQHPLKGGKASNYQGGVRVNSFVSGGFIPAAQRGKKLEGLIGIWDWCAHPFFATW